MLNKVILNGRIAREIELKQTEAGKSLGGFSIAVTRDYKNTAGEYESDFFDCTAFGQRAEYLSKYTSKGDMVSIVGRLKNDAWETKDGEKRYKVGIVVEEVSVLSRKKATEENEKKSNPAPKKAASNDDEEELPF